MYGLSSLINVSEFTGKELSQVCYTVNTICLAFEGDISITVMGSLIYTNGDLDSICKESLPLSSSNLMCLIGQTVRFAERGEDGSLTLNFENGHILTILDDSQEYESYSVCIGTNEIIV
jgi:Family of unknown function (DUF6188)